MSSIRYEKDADGVVTLLLDAPDQPVNTMNAAFQADLRSSVARLEAEKEGLRGVIVTSSKATFFAGGDLRTLLAVRPEDGAAFFRELEAMKACLRRIEKLGRPVVAAINGSALGGGLEIALSCHARLCIDDASIRIGFPEVTLGLLPGAGGVTKTVRLLGLQNALPFLTEGRQVAPARALEMGLIDGLVRDRDELFARARAWIEANPGARQPWDDPKHRIPGGTPSSPAVAAMLAIAPAMLQQQTRSNFPAPEAILSAAVEGAQVDVDTALRIESRYMTRLVTGQVAKNMIGTFFFQLNDVKAGKSRPVEPARWRATRVGILGAGMMGAGIAWACASRGLPSVLKDVDLPKAERGRAWSARLLASRVEKGRMSAADAEKVLAAITPTADTADLAGCDLVIEAVFENRDLKAEVTRETEAVLRADAIFASNTSTLPITGLAQASKRPERFIGLHFFSPVDRMQLVEIIKGKATSPETLARAYDFVQQIGKTPIVVNDARGFYTSRVFGTFVNEGMALLGEGVPAATVENAGCQIGMPVGPLAVLDEVSLKLADDVLHQELADLEREQRERKHGHAGSQGHEHGRHGHGHDEGHVHGDGCGHGHAHEHGHAHDHERSEPKAAGAGAAHRHVHKVKSRRVPESAVYVLEKMAHGFRRMGRSYGGGFYDYPADGEKLLWSGLQTFERGGRTIPFDDVKDRMLYVQAIETVRCLEEGVLESTRDANIGSIFGWGFPGWTGGTIQFIDHVGVRRFVARAQELAQRYGERFAPPALLMRHAERGEPL
jgi:3-hydroxyacyl-CoA dehydrogenase/enoyl-CoA hydratase/3-hydroxybutyryl-CoA epimerase